MILHKNRSMLSWPSWTTWLGSILFVYFAVLLLMTTQFNNITNAFILPAVIYIVAHLLRAIRLGVLLRAQKIRKLLALHFYTAACSTVIPFKLGELVRINEVSRWENNYCKGFFIVWIERIFDVIALGLLALGIYISGGSSVFQGVWGLLWAMFAFVFVSVIFFFVIPEQLSALNMHVMKSYTGRKAIKTLQMIEIISSVLERVKPIISERILTLSILTVFIWIFELISLMLFLDNTQIVEIVKDLLAQFSFALTESPKAEEILAVVTSSKNVLLIIIGCFSLIFYIKMNNKNNEIKG
ncbi:lysylphosphatidylglycerol synthase domain-containing protein [Atlantibacter hermannii]|uniref:lysylphosphatidylglycerol synthase domain-containing protein n=1 Tax=Atlantibacter hermannii TaxID=565 RepID=UPI0022B79120|nr:lysylphosphatidylglycerol synthase domain-containing protein [Atlantibacter hermannii]MCZ7834550.1 flippase-like domain-containing protein [Atlantibacter hermannii]